MPEISVPPAEAETHPTHLLVVEDEPMLRRLFTLLLRAAGYSVAEAEDGFAALEEIRRHRPALVLSDLNMPRMTGFELLSVVRRRFPRMHVIAMSGAFAGDNIPQGVAADAFYEKSGRPIGTLVEVIENILRIDTARQAGGGPAPEPQTAQASIALWVSRHGTSIEGPHILLSCPECLRSFPHPTGPQHTMELLRTPCIFCNVPVVYVLLDPSLTHHQGYAPSPVPLDPA